jgi:curved DNA-binding protein CbpA
MAQQLDPWRTLGLAPGASLEDVRRAYRRLAKANHPDAAGESAIPRFLAIQAAYEMLARPSTRRRPGTRPGTAATERPREPWQADPDRARASGRADGRRPGSRPTGTSAPPPGGGPTEPGSKGAGENGGTAAGSTASGPGRARRPSGRRRSPNKATPYSTSYDPGDEEPFEPGWSGAGWYGAASGTYWTINPKEYADPRKHGPEYQRRARRDASGGWILDEADPADVGDAAAAATEDEPPADPSAEVPGTPPPPGSAGPDESWTKAGPATGPAWSDAPRPGAAAAAREAGRPRMTLDWRSWFVQPSPGSRFRGPVLRPPSGSVGRLVVAFVGWVGLAAIVATFLGEMTGCSRFSVSCDETAAPASGIVLLALFLPLLALPSLATWLAHGTLAVFLLGLPTTILLSATGGARQPAASAAVITAVSAIAWVIGVAYAVVMPRLGSDESAGPSD